jgi:hypothetical protein
MERAQSLEYPLLSGQYLLLGQSLASLGQMLMAREYFQKCLEIKQQIFGARHPVLISVQCELANVLVALKEWAALDNLIEQMADTWQKDYFKNKNRNEEK